MTTTVETRREAIRALLLDGLAECTSEEEVEEAVAAGLDDYAFELDSKTAEFVLVHVEGALNVTMPTPADLGREQAATLGALLDAIITQLGETP